MKTLSMLAAAAALTLSVSAFAADAAPAAKAAPAAEAKAAPAADAKAAPAAKAKSMTLTALLKTSAQTMSTCGTWETPTNHCGLVYFTRAADGP